MRFFERLFMVVTSLALLAWCAHFISRSSFVVSGQRVFCLYDDAMISMTYARNLLEGHGLEWSRRGDHVEGFTHPLWLAVMVVANAIPSPLGLRSLFVQIASAACLVANLFAVRRLVQTHIAPLTRVAWPAVLATAAYYPLGFWAMYGMETGLQSLLVVLSIADALDIAGGRSRNFTRFFALLTCQALLRMDMALVIGPCLLVVYAAGRFEWPARREWGPGLAMFVGVNLAYFAFRLGYYGDLLPNTYYLKMTGTPTNIRVTRGLAVTTAQLRPLLPLLGGFLLWIVLSRGRAAALLGTIVALACAYSAWIGGDAWEWAPIGANRFVASAMPLVIAGGAGLIEAAAALPWTRMRLPTLGRAVLGLVLAALAIGIADGLFVAAPEARRKQITLEEELPHARTHQGWVTRVGELATTFDDDAIVAVEWAGIPAYFSDWRMADQLGYNDRHIAHGPNARSVTLATASEYTPGHMKWDYEYLFGELRVDALIDPWSIPGTAIVPAAHAHGYLRGPGFWYRADSRHVHVR